MDDSPWETIDEDFELYKKEFGIIKYLENGSIYYLIHNKITNEIHYNVDGTPWYSEDSYKAEQVAFCIWKNMHDEIDKTLLGGEDG